MLAVATGINELALTDVETNSLAKSVVELQKYYPMHVSGKALAWTNLAMVAGSIYGTRAVAIWARTEEKQKPPQNVMPFRQ